jgi:hypothetical protein
MSFLSGAVKFGTPHRADAFGMASTGSSPSQRSAAGRPFDLCLPSLFRSSGGVYLVDLVAAKGYNP